MKLIFRLLLNAIAVFVAAYLLEGVLLDGYVTALIVAVVLGVLNTFLKPILAILTLPITFLTLGLFALVLNVLMVLLTEWLVPGFTFVSIWWGVGFSIVLTFITWFLSLLGRD